MKENLEAGLHCRVDRGSTVVRIALRNDHRYDNQGNRAQSGRSRSWTSNRLCRKGIQLRRGRRVASAWREQNDRASGEGGGIGGLGTFPIGGLGAAEESPAPSLVHGQAEYALRRRTLWHPVSGSKGLFAIGHTLVAMIRIRRRARMKRRGGVPRGQRMGEIRTQRVLKVVAISCYT
ncbi:hypothetical protein B0J14DRAFT_564244 [Halenospora varia]|nr:hypothetical protein B0J14DRAFT_564244 [Halenospora varia]